MPYPTIHAALSYLCLEYSETMQSEDARPSTNTHYRMGFIHDARVGLGNTVSGHMSASDTAGKRKL